MNDKYTIHYVQNELIPQYGLAGNFITRIGIIFLKAVQWYMTAGYGKTKNGTVVNAPT